MAKQDDWVRLTVRMSPDLYERLQAIVASGPLSMNAEIVSRLEDTIGFMGILSGQEASERLAAMIRTSAASTLLDALAAVSRVWKEGGAELAGAEVYDRIAVKLNELLELKVTDLRVPPTPSQDR